MFCVMVNNKVSVHVCLGCKEEAELNNVLKSCIMVRRLKRQVLQQLPPKRRTQAWHGQPVPLL